MYIAYIIVPTIDFGPDPKNILLFLGGLWIISQVINPIFSIVLLPINLLTFGLLSFILNVAFVFGLMNFAPGFTVGAYNFPGANIEGVIFPSYNFTQILTVILLALIITISQKILYIIFE
ncbi:hypothetical protein A3J17_02470 [Candidatus Curtissbacteria bacterium RIFCSPLOWO2_02_FULL_40_11]|uniref:Uncharacterized protein n=1 Tax=Candidatus Curtissbacteria bacterium RIFCSPLOWO2_12_FULL_38_9 TaxID=1797735 RepID=A0A1F5ICZ0_9BACT|nr:MAG: hypothetical protein A2775_02040 [Candidatus Curtissbacteria bacterium RIFCSPHIGHO2_01_FULL_39_57]OGD90733.1 MAG: hypothetical protein A3E11_01915 [Candidatus Curtissbacteria bacterium RIFCSPHIGHO2_12_FULL_38_37]OGD99387.1 MAG: hypothetical protein A3J17_02470 [Candidatus Curtissbacteria bacterium RIFCSPLOWO2_02_FULL_40_11]OGE14246.1 MAG: hypothetical protein A3G14_04375 [Candidatus Curtissbacteria bacterium RIFCSPLOWO2_12_FULL_38_9]